MAIQSPDLQVAADAAHAERIAANPNDRRDVATRDLSLFPH